MPKIKNNIREIAKRNHSKSNPRIRIFYTKLQKEIAVKEKSITDNIREIIKRNHNKRNKKNGVS